MSTPTVPLTAPAGFPTPDQVRSLQERSDPPSVSLVMNTAPAAMMTVTDAARLRSLMAEANRRLAVEEPADAVPAVRVALDRAVAEAVESPTAQAVAVYASPTRREVFRLPVRVRDRVVVDPTFATRDLVRTLHRTPRHVVLVLSGRQARLLEAVGGVLRPVTRSPFPLIAGRGRSRDAGRQDRGDRGGRAASGAEAFLRTVDQSLGTFLRLHPAPVILVGPEPTVSAFRGRSRHLGRLAGTVRGNHDGTSPSVLAELVRPVLEEYLRSREQEALALVERRTGAGRAVSGLAAAWLAARHELPEMLAVEENHYVPARLTPEGDLLLPAEDVEHPEVIDDAVDELIELVLNRGGWVALTRPGTLATHEGVALALRRRDGS